MQTNTIGFFGGGRITRILLRAWANKEIILPSVLFCDTNLEVLNALKKQSPKIQMTDLCELASKQ